jgi:NADH:ubiquinone oxidoreductase subunit 6 (subunit J)
VIVHVLILWGAMAVAAALAVVVHRRRTRDEAPEYQSALTFVGAAYGLLLGLLVVFAVGHFNDVRHESQREASSLVALYDTVGVYPPETRHPVRHNVVCYMRSIVDDEWPSMERGNDTEAPRTLRFGDRLRADIRNLPIDDQKQGSTYGRAATLITDAGQSRQQLLFFTEPEIPTALWVVIYVGASLVFLLLVVHYASRPAGRVVALGSAAVLMTVVISVLGMLDQPFGIGARVQPDEMRQAVELVLTDEKNPAILGPCR